MKSILLTLFIITLFIHGSAQTKDSINWLTFEQLGDSLETKPKRVLLFFHTDWCGYCRKMVNDVFSSPQVIESINNDYYAVSFDAESTESVFFDGQLIKNKASNKTRGQYHDIALLLAHRQGQLVFPTLLLLDETFTIQKRYFNYMGPNKIIQALKY